jgi:hypothetical protein
VKKSVRIDSNFDERERKRGERREKRKGLPQDV